LNDDNWTVWASRTRIFLENASVWDYVDPEGENPKLEQRSISEFLSQKFTTLDT
jgi:hypothetical protein